MSEQNSPGKGLPESVNADVAADFPAPIWEIHEPALPNIGDLRNATNDLLEAINDRELALALKEGDRISSFSPFLEWLSRDGPLYVRQFAERLIWDMKCRRDVEALELIALTANRYLAKLARSEP